MKTNFAESLALLLIGLKVGLQQDWSWLWLLVPIGLLVIEVVCEVVHDAIEHK
jgi:hypothetical protein